MPRRPPRTPLSPLLIAGIYAAASWLWITFSDQLVSAIAGDPTGLTRLQTLKGLFFVTSTALLLFLLIHQAQARLARSEARYRALFVASPMPQLLLDADSHAIINANEAACTLYGRPLQELLGRPLRELLADTRPGVSVLDPTHGQHRHLDHHGKPIDVRIVSSRLQLDKRDCLLLHIRDVTESIQLERARLQAEHNFREVLASSLFVLYRHNLSSDSFDYISPSVSTLTGLDRDALMQPGGGALLRAHFHPDDLLRAAHDNAAACRASHGPSAYVDTEMRLRSADGRYRWVHNAKTLLLAPDGQVTHVVGAAVDVTDSHSAREHLLVTLRSIADGVITTDERNRVELMNPVAEQLTGWSEADARGCPLESVLSIDPPLPADDGEQQLIGRRSQLHPRDGSVLPVSCSRAPIRVAEDAPRSGSVLVIHDLSAELAARARLDAEEQRHRESQARYALAMQGTNEGLWDWSPLTRELLLSSRLLAILGVPGEHLLTTSDDWLERIHPADRPLFQRTLIAHLQRHTPHFECEYRVRADNGEYRWVLARGLALYDDQGIAYRMVGSVGDITERKRDEEKLRELNQALEQRVAERTMQLQATLQELESFSYSVSHDLRAPLRAIDGYSAILSQDYAEQLDGEAATLLQRMRAAVQRMGRLIDDLLKLSRVSRQPLERQNVDISALARSIVDELRLREPERVLACHIADGLQAQADPSLLQVVLQNLLDNAWKFSARQPDARISLDCEQSDKGERIYCVRDNGAGFDMRYQDKLFAPFQRLHSDRDFEGTGVGLATVARIIHRHGGRVWAESSPDGGATFRFTLGEP